MAVHIDVVAQGFLHRHGHDLDFAGSGVDLQQQTAILAVVEEQFTIERHIKCCLEFAVGGAHLAGHQFKRTAHGRIARAHIHPVTIANGRPRIILATIRIRVGGGRRAVGVHVDDAVVLAKTGVRMRDLRSGITGALLNA